MIKVSIGKLQIGFDPIDRMLISQAINRDYLMSDDGKFEDYDCKLI